MKNYQILGEKIDLIPLRYRDHKNWVELRNRNKDWLSPWEATRPKILGEIPNGKLPSSYWEMIYQNRQDIKNLRNFAFGIWLNHLHSGCKSKTPELIGQINLAGLVFGAMRGANIGYWIDENHSGQGYMTEAVKILSRFSFEKLGLRRIEINCRPENLASIQVALKAGYQFEGSRPSFLHIAGDWRDHNVYVLLNSQIL